MIAPQRYLANLIFTIVAFVPVVTDAADVSDLSGEYVLHPAAQHVDVQNPTVQDLVQDECQDRIWLISTRHLSSDACRANLYNPSPVVCRLDRCGRTRRSSMPEFYSLRSANRPTVIYVHGNRTSASVAIRRGLTIHRYIARHRGPQPIDWVIWSWPSEQHGLPVRDAREKAKRTDAHGMYLALFLRDNFTGGAPPTMIGYSFGGRMVTGSLHALAGGPLGGRRLPGPALTGAGIRAGLVAPAIESNWLLPNGYHGKATQNLNQMVLMYNHRDSVLKRYWLLDRVRGSMALGYSGPRTFGPRFDGSRLPVIARDFAKVIGNHHDELDYYQKDYRASSEMARLIYGKIPSQSIR